MSARVAQIWRHPIKSHGYERLRRVSLEAGKTMPWDRVWAVAHEAAKTDGTAWAPCANYSRGAKAPSLMAIDCLLDEVTEAVTLTHPERGPISFRPDAPEDARRFLDWVAPLMPEDRAQSVRIDRVPDRGMTDTPFPSISLASLASLDALSERTGIALDPRRFRQNVWIEGMAPFEEFDLVGHDVTIGNVQFKVEERITRCLATAANPETGVRDADTLGQLEAGWNHTDLGVYLVVLEGGDIAVGDQLSRTG